MVSCTKPSAFAPETTELESESAPEPVRTSWRRDKSLDPAKVIISDSLARSLATIRLSNRGSVYLNRADFYSSCSNAFDKRLAVKLLKGDSQPGYTSQGLSPEFSIL